MDVRVPRLGEGADSGTVAAIFVKEGDRVRKDQPVLEIESEKAVATIPCTADGTVTAIHVKEGDVINVGQLILSIAEGTQEAAREASHKVIDVTVGDEETDLQPPPEVTGPPVAAAAPAAPAPVASDILAKAGLPPAAAPTVRMMARELGIDLRLVRGSERGGRIIVADLKRYIQQLQQRAKVTESAAMPAGLPLQVTSRAATLDVAQAGPVRREKVSILRKTISARMSESWAAVPRVTQFDEADVSALLQLKKKYDKRYEKKGARLTLTGLALKALVPVLKRHPVINASLDETRGEIVFKEYYHIGIAVDTEQGLIVPVLRDVDKSSMLQISLDLAQLAERTRQRKIGLEEMQGGTFTVSNQGGIGSGPFTPIVNVPEVAILGMGRGVLKPVVRKGRIEKRTIVPLSLSYDHRLVDGANAARFMVDLVQAFENFNESELKAGL